MSQLVDLSPYSISVEDSTKDPFEDLSRDRDDEEEAADCLDGWVKTEKRQRPHREGGLHWANRRTPDDTYGASDGKWAQTVDMYGRGRIPNRSVFPPLPLMPQPIFPLHDLLPDVDLSAAAKLRACQILKQRLELEHDDVFLPDIDSIMRYMKRKRLKERCQESRVGRCSQRQEVPDWREEVGELEIWKAPGWVGDGAVA
ncbi:hypothetical protein BC835DRAFT_1421540 [Cytidiella melzeri]|nr:hypothetical protein BC835DRAFT_1421540 [Cytidiella melzeri]